MTSSPDPFSSLQTPPPPPPSSFAAELGRVLFPGRGGEDADTLARLAISYDESLRQGGPHPNAVLWYNRKAQEARFRTLLRVLGPDARARGLSINDLGCGYGALFAYLRRSRVLRGGRYFGYDISPRMVAEARRLHARDRRAEFVHAPEATQAADFSFASGTFGLCMDVPADRWRTMVRATLRQLAAQSRRGMAFNLLDARGPDNRDTLYYAHPDDYLAFCRDELGAKAVAVPTFKDYDFAILCRFDGTDPAEFVRPWWRRLLRFRG